MLILRSKSFFRLLLSLGILLLGAKSTLAQDYVNGTGAPTFTTSLPVELGFVNVSNGNLHLEIPIASPPQRGNIVLGEKLVYDSRMWMPVDNGTSQVWQPMNSNSGWRFVHVRKSGTVTYDANVYNCTNGQSGTYTDYTNFVWTSPDGTKIPFPVETKSGCSADVSSNDAFASDASGYHMWVSNFTQAYVINTTGNQLYDVPRDNNGNYVTQKGNGDAIDTLNRVPVTTTVVGNQTFLDVLSSQNTTNRYTLNYSNITVNTAFSQSGVTEYSGSIQVLSSVQLPNGTSYQFTYDSYGELATVTLPTGGLLSYGYTNFVDSYGQKNRWISSRTTVGGTWSYTPSVISSCSGGSQNCQQKVVVTKPSNDSIQYTFTLNGGAWNSQAVYYDHSGAQLATVTNDYDLSKTCTGCNGAAYVTKSRHTTSLNSSTGTVTKKTEYSYNATWNTLVTAVKDWNLYTGTPGTTPDRETDITYVSDDAHLSKNMLNLPTSVTVKNGAGTQLAQTLYTYDRYDLTGLSDVPGVVQHDSAFDISRSTRGNVTTVQKWVAGSTYLTWKYWYDITGHVTKSADSAGNITTYSYADNFYTDTGANPPPGYAPSGVTNAYPTTTTLPIIGAQTAGYYFGNGGAAFSTDQNGATSYSHYLDPLNRRTITTDSAGGWVDTSYTSATQTDTYTGINDATPSTACTSCRHDQTIFDGVARKIRSSLVSDPEGTTSTDTSYDVNGRAGAVSNPYRSTTESTYGTTTSIYDGLDRVTQIIRPDNNAVNVSYGAAAGSVSQLCSIGTYGIGYPVLSSDEAGKKRLTWYSGFGKIIEVDEPNSSGILNVATCYKYDGLNNLKAIAQQAQSRTYVYDGLSRVTSSIIPESGTTTFSYVSGSSLCSGNPSNPCSQTDARGITTTYAYDSLNRIKQKSYSDGTPTVTYEYDQGSLWTVPLSNTKGRLSHVAVAGNRSERIFSYDTVGRIVRQTECLPSNCGIAAFTTTLTYSPGGNLVTINYPSTRQITYAYTNAGRVSSVTQTSIHGSGQNYSYASGLTYAPTGAAKGLPLNGGSGLSETYNYNNRLQMISQQLGTASTTFMSHSLSYLDASGNNDGNVMSVADNLSSARTQSFTYDPLNRLATANETNWGLGYVYDVYGNLLQQNVTAGTAPGLSVLVNTKNQIADSGFSYDAAGNLTSDGMNTYAYNAANQLTSVNAGVGTYTYDYGNVRVRKDTGSTYTEYIRVGGNVIAENDPAKGWSDYIFLGNRRLARADDYWQNLRIYGTANSSGQYAFFYWGNPGALNNYTIRSGDKLYLWQYQFTGAKGGMILSFGDGTSSGWTVKDQDGYYLNDDQTQGVYHARTVDLTSLAGKTITQVAANSESDTAVGSWIIMYGQIALESSDGTVRSLYTGQSSSPIGSVAGTSGETGLGHQIDIYSGQGSNTALTTAYYHGDHLGSARMMTSGNGYPIWQATYLPFGYEYNPQLTTSHYKFTGYEHDDESGLENANARMLSSQFARFTSPDRLSGHLSNPQSLNKYVYALDNPIENEDPTGDDTSSSDGGSHGFWGSIGGFFSNVWNSVSGAVGNFFSPNPGPQPTESTTTTIIYNGQVIGGGTTTRSGTSSSPPPSYDPPIPLDIFHNSPSCPNCGSTWVNAAGAGNAAGYATLGVAGLGLGMMGGLAGATTAVSPIADGTMVTVTHYTTEGTAALIEESGAINAESYVTLPSQIPPGSSPMDVQSLLEINPGKGDFSVTFQTPQTNLFIPEGGPVTSGGSLQFQLYNPVPIPPGSFVPTPF